jgi:hypothetical protein
MKNTSTQPMTKDELLVVSKELVKAKGLTPKHYCCKILSKDMGGNRARVYTNSAKVNSKKKFPT